MHKTPMDKNQVNSENLTATLDKKPYEKPSFRSERVFVTTALSCGKVNPGVLSCSGNLSAS